MPVWGINALNHGSSLSVFNHGTVSFYSSEQDGLPRSIVKTAFDRSAGPDRIYWYERPWLKKARQLRAGQYSDALDMSVLPSNYVNTLGVGYANIIYTPHHASHAAAGYYTSPFCDAAVVVLDAIGEMECASIWHGSGDHLIKKWSRNYPHSLGLFYSAFTKLIGYRPILEEHRLQDDSYMGDPNRYYDDIAKYFKGTVDLNYNFHRGVGDWCREPIYAQDRFDIAAAVQRVFEEQVESVMTMAKRLTGSDCLVYMGGCAMNSRYNRKLDQRWNRVWSLPNPGDASSSLGAVLYHTQQRITAPYMGLVKHLEISV
jgi:carbamoyltransferase